MIPTGSELTKIGVKLRKNKIIKTLLLLVLIIFDILFSVVNTQMEMLMVLKSSFTPFLLSNTTKKKQILLMMFLFVVILIFIFLKEREEIAIVCYSISVVWYVLVVYDTYFNDK